MGLMRCRRKSLAVAPECLCVSGCVCRVPLNASIKMCINSTVAVIALIADQRDILSGRCMPSVLRQLHPTVRRRPCVFGSSCDLAAICSKRERRCHISFGPTTNNSPWQSGNCAGQHVKGHHSRRLLAIKELLASRRAPP
ncbi:hypothetical protein DENSPDRAFT_621066 [Dentipellis sp. KUC8613]|nr:hypothetical protein DENSPDRAFT_621066 [Dentipellis sp. KUC8613]